VERGPFLGHKDLKIFEGPETGHFLFMGFMHKRSYGESLGPRCASIRAGMNELASLSTTKSERSFYSVTGRGRALLKLRLYLLGIRIVLNGA